MLKNYVLFCQQPKDIMFTVIEVQRNQKIITIQKLEKDNSGF